MILGQLNVNSKWKCTLYTSRWWQEDPELKIVIYQNISRNLKRFKLTIYLARINLTEVGGICRKHCPLRIFCHIEKFEMWFFCRNLHTFTWNIKETFCQWRQITNFMFENKSLWKQKDPGFNIFICPNIFQKIKIMICQNISQRMERFQFNF